MGQPKKGEEKNRNVRLGFRVTEPMYEALKAHARRHGVEMSDWVVRVLAQELGVPASETNAERDARMKKPQRRSAGVR